MNPMRKIELEKVTLNMGCSDDKIKLKKSVKFLESIINQKVKIVKTKKRNTFGMAKGRDTAVKVTLRYEDAKKFLGDALESIDKRLKSKQINAGNFSFGVKETIDLPNVKYDPDIGILGLDVCVTLKRSGYRIKYKKIGGSKIGKKHLITKDETISWLKDGFGVEIDG